MKTLQEFQREFDALPATQHVLCRRCGAVGRNGCAHLVEDFAPVPDRNGTPWRSSTCCRA